MITKINSENYGQYQALFQDAELSLRADETLPEEYRTIEIRDLDAYIANIEQLRKLEVEQYDHHFTTLPLDEPPFAIDANSRHIEIPTDFKKNGMAVIGDHLAEIIYFSIDRYYDTWDLLESGMHAMVQWVHVSGGKELEKGISPITEIDGTILVNDRKILLGWPIDNSITQNAGTIKFSVRFYKFDSIDGENHLVFNMNTIPTTIEVKSGLNFMSDDGVPAFTPQDITNIFEKRFGPGFGYVNGGDGAETPWFIIPLSFYSVEDNEPVINEITFTDDEPVVADLVDGSLMIGLAAGGNGSVTYSAHNKATSEETDISNSFAHFVTEDTIADGGKIYYIHNLSDDSYSIAHVVAGDSLVPTQEEIDAHTEIDPDTQEPVLTADLNYYERIYLYEITGVGTYCIKATNKVLPASTKHKESGQVLVPGPHTPDVDVDSAIFLNPETNKFTIEMTGYTDQEINGVKDKISYYITDNNGFEETLEDQESNVAKTFEFDAEDVYDGEEINKFTANLLVSVSSSRNGTTIDLEEPKSIRVTYPPELPELAITASRANASISNGDYFSITVTNDGDILSDDYLYQWYKVVDEQDVEGIEPNDIPIENAVSDVYAPTEGGAYYCKVKNVVNGRETEPVSSDYKTIY